MSPLESEGETSRRRLTVVHVIPTFGVGGALGGVERLLLGIGKYADRRRYKLIAALLNSSDRSRDRLLASDGFDVAYLGEKPRGHVDVSIVRRLRGYLKSVNADIIHAHAVSAGFYSQLACLLGPRHVLIYHQHREPTRLQRRLRVLQHFLPPPQAVIAVSRSTAELARTQLRFKSDTVRVVYNGIELSGLPTPIPVRDAAAVVACGRLSPEKGLDCLIDAMVRIRAAVPSATLHLVGEGPARRALGERARANGLADDVVTFHGFQLEPETVIARAAVFALPSWEEGLPLSLLEAMAVGAAVVASKVGGVPEVISHGLNGLLVRPGDTAGLAEAIIALLSDSVLRARLGEAAARTARRFHIASTVEGIEEVYETLARQHFGLSFDVASSCWCKAAIPLSK